MRKSLLICLTVMPLGGMTESAMVLPDDKAAGTAGLAVSASILFVLLWLAFRCKAAEHRIHE